MTDNSKMHYEHLFSRHKKKKIDVNELSHIFSQITDYIAFCEEINHLVDEGILSPVKSSGYNGKSPRLFNRYTLDKSKLESDKRAIIARKNLKLHKLIHLDAYYALPFSSYEKDIVLIDKIDAYLKRVDDISELFLPELSFNLVGDEKWIQQKSGKNLLMRIGLWDKLNTLSEPSPVAYALNYKRMLEISKDNKCTECYLIVENKTTFIHAMNHIEHSSYVGVIYGQGWKILSGIGLFEKQLKTGNKKSYEYFGDVDRTGIAILQSLRRRYDVQIAVDFYAAVIPKKRYKGKVNQHLDLPDIMAFVEDANAMLNDKSMHNFDYIIEMLKDGYYQPQEILSQEDIQSILSSVRWHK